MTGKSIRLFLVDGSPSGLMTAEIGQWTGKALVCPRQSLSKLGKRNEAKRPGVYILAGTDPERPGRERVYIGEAENVYERLKSHDSDPKKDWWSRVCLFAAVDLSLTKAHIKFLESRLIELARTSERSLIDNATSPPRPSLPEADIADMEMFLSQALVLMPVIGFRFAQPVIADETSDGGRPDAPVEHASFVLRTKGAEAQAQVTDDAFVVLKGSTASRQDVASWDTYKTLRDDLVEQGLLAPHPQDDTLFIFQENVPFSSPSAAGTVICARNANGRTEWKTTGGQTYADWQEQAQAASESDA